MQQDEINEVGNEPTSSNSQIVVPIKLRIIVTPRLEGAGIPNRQQDEIHTA
jgi:hypothetical protein